MKMFIVVVVLGFMSSFIMRGLLGDVGSLSFMLGFLTGGLAGTAAVGAALLSDEK